EPATVEEGIGLSPRVAAAVPEAARLVAGLIGGPAGESAGGPAGDETPLPSLRRAP
ncbi:protease, partial [Streptomyces sp. 13-12-16]